MRKITTLPTLALIVLAASSQVGHARPIHDDGLARSDFGAYPPDYKALVRSWSEQNLSHPEALQFGHVSRPRREWTLKNTAKVYGWSVCAMITAPNAYGEETGPQTVWFLIHAGKVVDIRQSDTISPGHFVNCSNGSAPATG